MKKFKDRKGLVRLTRMLQKVKAGDVILDAAFDPYANGVTSYSLKIWNHIKKHIDVTKFTKAEMTFVDGREWYTLTLTHLNGFKVKLKGVSSGYHGEGTRGCYQVLKDCGFSKPERVFQKGFENWVMKKATITTVAA